MKVQLSINDKLMERADSYAEKNYLKRSDLISLALTEYLNAKEFTAIVPELLACMRAIADNDNKIDDETQQKLNEIEYLFKFLSGK